MSLHGPGLWYATRATGLVTLLLLTVSVLFGILTAGRFASGTWPRFSSTRSTPAHCPAAGDLALRRPA